MQGHELDAFKHTPLSTEAVDEFIEALPRWGYKLESDRRRERIRQRRRWLPGASGGLQDGDFILGALLEELRSSSL